MSTDKSADISLPERDFTRGLVQVYTGNGKGKTTAALGLAVRATGQGLKVAIIQFMKGVSYGELTTLACIPNITVKQFGHPHWVDPKNLRDEDREVATRAADEARAAMHGGNYDLVILDEVNVAAAWGLLPVADIVDLIRSKPPTVELVLTGRMAPPEIVALADLVTEMREVKHPFQQGIGARRGIEF